MVFAAFSCFSGNFPHSLWLTLHFYLMQSYNTYNILTCVTSHVSGSLASSYGIPSITKLSNIFGDSNTSENSVQKYKGQIASASSGQKYKGHVSSESKYKFQPMQQLRYMAATLSF